MWTEWARVCVFWPRGWSRLLDRRHQRSEQCRIWRYLDKWSGCQDRRHGCKWPTAALHGKCITFLQHDAGWKVGEDDKMTQLMHEEILVFHFDSDQVTFPTVSALFLIVAAFCIFGDVIGIFWATSLWLLRFGGFFRDLRLRTSIVQILRTICFRVCRLFGCFFYFWKRKS